MHNPLPSSLQPPTWSCCFCLSSRALVALRMLNPLYKTHSRLLVHQNSPRQGGDTQALFSTFNQCQRFFLGHFYFYQSVVNTGFKEMGEEHPAGVTALELEITDFVLQKEVKDVHGSRVWQCQKQSDPSSDLCFSLIADQNFPQHRGISASSSD